MRLAVRESIRPLARGGRRVLAGGRAHPRIVALLLALALVAALAPVLLGLSLAPSSRTAVVHRAPTPLAVAGAPEPTVTPQPPRGGAAAIDGIAGVRAATDLAYVNALIAHMSLDEEVGQMVMVGFLETQMSPALAYEISHYHVGSVILYAWNIVSAQQVKALTAQLQSTATLPLLVATDQEGGDVNRLQAIAGNLPSAQQIGATNDPSYAYQRGQQDAQQLASLGINVNFAPVVDVQNVPSGVGDLSGRMFGATPQQVTKMAGAYLDGLQASGKVAGTLKHFPGLGDVPVDPHQQLYTQRRSVPELEAIDWAPYKALLATGQVQLVMTTHVVLAAVDPTTPASLSYKVVTGVLRDQLGFNGVVVTDGIYMKALWGTYPSIAQVFLAAVEAGNDIICSTWSIDSTTLFVQTIEQAVRDGTLTKTRIDASVRRILLLKLHEGLLPRPAAG